MRVVSAEGNDGGGGRRIPRARPRGRRTAGKRVL